MNHDNLAVTRGPGRRKIVVGTENSPGPGRNTRTMDTFPGTRVRAGTGFCGAT
jgi:hypothetical protein